MKVDLTYQYEEDDWQAVMLAHHEKTVGQAPAGYQWVAVKRQYTSEIEITAKEIKQPAPAIEVPAAPPTAP